MTDPEKKPTGRHTHYTTAFISEAANQRFFTV